MIHDTTPRLMSGKASTKREKFSSEGAKTSLFMNCGCQKTKLPGVGQMAGNLAAAAGRMVASAAAGNELLVSAEVRAARLSQCLACEQVRKSSDGTAHRCLACGCWLDGKLACKACLATETCPAGKW